MKSLICALLLTPMVALAGPGKGGGMGGPPTPEMREKAQQRMRMMLVVGLAEALELSEGEAIQMAEKIRAFDDRRRPIREAIMESSLTLKKAADGDAAALGQVDQATQKILDGRQQMAALDKEMFNSISQGLSPERKAKLALFLARFHGEMKDLMRHGGKGRFHPGGR